MAEKSNAPSSTLDQVPTGELAGSDVVRPDRDAARVARNRTPAREMRALTDELLHSFAVFGVIAIAQQDQPVGTVAVLVLDVPVVLHALERYQEVQTAVGAGPGDRAEHCEEERVDHALVGSRVLEKQQRDRIRPLATQRRGVLVDRIIEIASDGFDPCPGIGADRFVAAERAAHRGLRYPCGIGDIETGRPTCRLSTHRSPPPGHRFHTLSPATIGTRGGTGNLKRCDPAGIGYIGEAMLKLHHAMLRRNHIRMLSIATCRSRHMPALYRWFARRRTCRELDCGPGNRERFRVFWGEL